MLGIGGDAHDTGRCSSGRHALRVAYYSAQGSPRYLALSRFESLLGSHSEAVFQKTPPEVHRGETGRFSPPCTTLERVRAVH
jgi:hypothetical protein